MKLKSTFVAGLLALSAAHSMALGVTTYNKTFTYVDPGNPIEVVPLGFGRGGDKSILPPAGAPGAPPKAFTPGVLPFSFHDLFQFNGLLPGVYSFDTTISTIGNAAFGLVMLEYYSNGTLNSITFDISPDLKTAHGVGSFTVDPGCDVKYCVFTHVFGWDDGDKASGYSGTVTATPVPEPASAALLMAGMATLGWLARRRRAD